MSKYHLIIIIILLLLAVIAVLFLTSDQDIIGLTVSKNPQRIITLSPNLTEIVFALGLDDKVIAVSSDSDYPLQAKDKLKVGSFWQPDIEAIIAAKPDLVIAEDFEQQANVAEALGRADIRVLTLSFDRIFQLRQAIQKIGDAAGCRDEADKVINNIENRIVILNSEFRNLNKPKVLWVVQTEPLRVASSKTFINDILEIAGGTNIIGQTLMQYPQINEEILLANPPEVVIQSAMGQNSITEQQKDAEKFWAKYVSLPAVKNGRIYVVDSDLVLRLGPRLPQGIEAIARILHPEKFKQADSNNMDKNG